MKKQTMLGIFVLIVCVFVVNLSLALAFDLTEFGFKPAGAYDFGGETVTIISWTSERMEKYFNDYLPVQGRIEEAEEMFNCKIDFLQTRDIPELNFNRLLAGESVNDLWHVQNKIGYWELVANKAAYPMGELLGDKYYSNLPPSLVAVEEALKFKDQYWGIGTVEWLPIYGYQNDMLFVIYNKDMIERYGLEDPYELYLNGEWTWDAVTALGLKVTADTDGDGVIDQCAASDVRVWDLAVSNGASMTKVDENGKIVFAADEPAYIEAFEQIYQWCTELQIINSACSFKEEKSLFGFSQLSFNLPNAIEQNNFNWGIVPLPKGPSADKNYWTVQAISTTIIPMNAKDPEALAALRAFLWREEDVELGDVLARHVNSQESANVFLIANREWEGQASRLFQRLMDEFEVYAREIYAGERSAAAAMAEFKPVIQGRLDDLFDE